MEGDAIVTNTKIRDMEMKLEAARIQAAWEAEHPQALQDAIERGKAEGFAEGWAAASRWLGQLAVGASTLHHTSAAPPPPVPLSELLRMIQQLVDE